MYIKSFKIFENTKGLEFKDFFTQISEEHEEFEDHIKKSIPSYSEMSYLSAIAIASIYKDSLILDIGSSEGYWGDIVVSKSNNWVHSLDPNWKMKEVFQKKRKTGLEKNIFLQKAFGEGFFDADEGRYYKGYRPKNKYDVVRESMTFQFMSTNRSKQYGLCKDALKEDGLFITNSKNKLSDEKEYMKYEKLKDEYKKKYFSEKEIDKKAKDILPSMSKYMVKLEETLKSLNEHFEYVKQYWVSGNFHGFACSDSKIVVENFLKRLPEKDQFPNSVVGLKLSI